MFLNAHEKEESSFFIAGFPSFLWETKPLKKRAEKQLLTQFVVVANLVLKWLMG